MIFSFVNRTLHHDFLPLCVCLFCDCEIDKERIEDELPYYEERYPGYSFLVLLRRRCYENGYLNQMSRYKIIARLIPKPDEAAPEFLIPEYEEELRHDYISFFMDTLVRENRARIDSWGFPPQDDISEWVNDYFPDLYRSDEDATNEMAQIFERQMFGLIDGANDVILTLEKRDRNRNDNGVNGIWTPILIIDGERHVLPIGRRKKNKLGFTYLMLHPYESISASNFPNDIARQVEDNEISRTNWNELQRIAGVLYDEYEEQPRVALCRSCFIRNQFSRNLSELQRLATIVPGITTLPFTWIRRIGANTGNTLAQWRFDPPRNVRIDLGRFRQEILNF